MEAFRILEKLFPVLCWLFIHADGFGQCKQDVVFFLWFLLLLLLLLFVVVCFLFVCCVFAVVFVCLVFCLVLGGRNVSLVYSLPVVFIYFGTAENLEQTKPVTIHIQICHQTSVLMPV